MKLQRVDYEEICKKFPHVRNIAPGDLVVQPYVKPSINSSQKIPEWGFVQISITLPMGDDLYSDKNGELVLESLWETPSGGEKRYKGVGLVDTLGFESKKGIQQIYHVSSESRFGADIAMSMGAMGSRESKCLNSYSWIAPAPSNNSPEGDKDPAPRCRFELAPVEGLVGEPVVELASFELLQYEEQITGRGGYQRYLAMHFIASDCTSEQLEKISQSLTKPRNKCAARGGGSISIAKEAVKFICGELTNGSQGSYNFEFGTGGFLVSGSNGYGKKTDNNKKGSRKKRNNTYSKPSRSVCAIPNVPLEKISYIPKVFEKFAPAATNEKSKSMLWAAQLSRGFDQYSEEIPTLEALQANQPEDFYLKNWSLLVEDSCIVAVRNTPKLSEDPNIIILTPTCYIDLLLLVQRSYSTLRSLSEQLHDIDSQVDTVSDFKSEDEAHRYNTELRKQFKQLLLVQNRFSALRKNLWFNAIPRRQLDTLILLQLRQETGVQNLYDDLVDEVRFRHRIHDMTYREFDAELKEKERARREKEDEERRRLREAEEKRREDEADERRKQLEKEEAQREETAKRQEKFATILSIVGFIAIPLPLLNDGLAFVQEMRGAENPLWLQAWNFLWIGVVAVLGLILLTFLIYKILKKTRGLEIIGISPYDPRQYQKSQRRKSQ